MIALVCGRTAEGSPEDEHWQQVLNLRVPTAPTGPYSNWLAREQERRRALLTQVQLYQTLYPGGEHRDDAIRAELLTLFELAVASGTSLERVCERARQIRHEAPSPAAVHEAAYWELVCGRGSGAPASRPATGPPPPPFGRRVAGQGRAAGPECRRAVRAYVEQYPESRYAPKLAAVLFDEEQHDPTVLETLIAPLRPHHAGDPMLDALEAKLRRTRAVGRPFWPALRLTSGRALEREGFAGRRVLLLVWAGFDRASRAYAARVGGQGVGGGRAVISIQLDEDPAAAEAAAAQAGLRHWVVCDGLGWGGEFVRAWGVDRIPFEFEIDAEGRLVRAGEPEWRPAPGGAPGWAPDAR